MPMLETLMNNGRFIARAAISAALLVAATLGVVQPAAAHHAFAAEFDGKAPVLLRGKVNKVEWVNPHAWVHMVVLGADGKGQEWMVEAGTPNTLARAGVDRNSLKPGMEIVVRGYQSLDRACTPVCKANGRDITFPDGRKAFVGSSGTGAPKDNADPNEH
jgi:Family of unknown function (DUF6152)